MALTDQHIQALIVSAAYPKRIRILHMALALSVWRLSPLPPTRPPSLQFHGLVAERFEPPSGPLFGAGGVNPLGDPELERRAKYLAKR